MEAGAGFGGGINYGDSTVCGRPVRDRLTTPPDGGRGYFNDGSGSGRILTWQAVAKSYASAAMSSAARRRNFNYGGTGENGGTLVIVKLSTAL